MNSQNFCKKGKFISDEYWRDMYRCYMMRTDIYKALETQSAMMLKWGLRSFGKQYIYIVEPDSKFWARREKNNSCLEDCLMVMPATSSVNRMDLSAFYGTAVHVTADRINDFSRNLLRELTKVKPSAISFVALENGTITEWNGKWSNPLNNDQMRLLEAFFAKVDGKSNVAKAQKNESEVLLWTS